MTTKRNILEAIQRLSRKEQAFLDSEFLSPVVAGGVVRVRLAGVSCRMRMRPAEPLIDASDAVRRGGTGQLADWSRAAALARSRPVMLAGGLRGDNVAEAVRCVRPWAVDVSSGVEDRPGIKSADRLREFFRALTHVATEDE